MFERRGGVRVRGQFKASLSRNGRALGELRVLNISQGGILAISPNPVPLLSKNTLAMELDGRRFEGEAIAVRVSAEAPWEAALFFVGLAEEFREALERFLAGRLGIHL